MKKGLIVLSSIILASCIFYPKTIEPDPNCITLSKELELKSSTTLIDSINSGSCGNEGCLAVAAVMLGVSAGSYIVSGSIVLVGNTVNWLERKTACDYDDTL